MPIMTRVIVLNHEARLDHYDVRTSIGTLYLNQYTGNLRSCKEYHMWFMYRRLLLAFVIVFVDQKIGNLQISITAYLSLIVIAYLFMTLPMDKPHHNWLALYNEISVYCSCVCLIYFTDFVVDPELRYEGGNVFL
jgi:hypothetical protein